jgi:2-dehydro-3-deoxygluconokinase
MHLVSLGECLVEFSRRDDGAWAEGFAGDVVNALFYAARLGLQTGFVSAVGDDLFGEMIVHGIEREGIDTSHLLRLEGRANGLYFIDLDSAGEYTFHFWRDNSAATETLMHHDRDQLISYISGSRYFLLSGITLAVMRSPERLLNLLRRLQGKTSVVLDTNYRAALWPSPEEYRRRIEEILPMVDIFLPTLGDLQVAWPSMSLETLCSRFTEQGPSTIVIKMGDRGCATWSNGSLTEIPALSEVKVIDTTGAGDAFNGGFLAGLIGYNDTTMAINLAQQTAAQALVVYGALNLNVRIPNP